MKKKRFDVYRKKIKNFSGMKSKGLYLLIGLFLLPPVLLKAQPDKRFDLQVQQKTLQQIVEQVRSLTGLTFAYQVDDMQSYGEISLDLTQKTVAEILNESLKNTSLAWHQVDNTVIIYKTSTEPPKPMLLKGVVRDANNQPLPGVTVRLAGSTVGTATDSKGCFSCPVPVKEGKLEFSFIGFKKYVLDFTEKSATIELKITLEEDVQAMEEVVVTGYGNISKGNYTGAATTVKGEDILMAGVASVDQMLQGVIPGMLVTTTTGQVGATPKIRVRGTSTLLGSQEPVWVVDGVIQRDPLPFDSDDNLDFSVDADDITRLAGNAISWLNPADIESITVLKDASATAIYGSQAANGVIVITTKKASAGKMVVTYSGDLTIGQRPHYGLYDLMNSEELVRFHDEMYKEGKKLTLNQETNYEYGYYTLMNKVQAKEVSYEDIYPILKKTASYNTDWFDLLFRNSLNHQHSLSISGGFEKLQNRTSISYNNQRGEAIGNNLTSFSMVSNTTVRLWDKVVVNLNLTGTIRKVDGFAYGVDLFKYAYQTARTIPVRNDDGSLYYYGRGGKQTSNPLNNNSYYYKYNILNEMATTGSETRTRTWGGTLDLRWELIRGLEYQGMFSYNSSSTDMRKWATEKSQYISKIRMYNYGEVSTKSEEEKMSPLPMGGLLSTDLSNVTSITVRNGLVYDRLFAEKHRMTLQVGIEINTVERKGNAMARYGYMPDRGETFVTLPYQYTNKTGIWYDNPYAQGAATITNRLQNELSGYVLAVYTYNDRYVFNTSARVDASNRFGQEKNKRFEPTWSIGLKWRVAQESFLQERKWLNNLDVYGSYGYQGNAVTTVTPELTAKDSYIDYYGSYGKVISSLPYPDLGWEKTKTWNFGIDGSLLDGRLNFNFNYFKKNSDVIANESTALENGTSTAIQTGIKMENTGYDFVVNMVPIRTKDFTWQLSVNSGTSRNKMKSKKISTVNDYLNGACQVGETAYSTFYSFKFKGLNPKTGEPLFYHVDLEEGEEVGTFEDPTGYMVKSGKLTPDFSGGVNMSLKYRNFTLYALFSVQWGGSNRVPNPYSVYSGNWNGLAGTDYNMSRRVMKRWKQPGDEVLTNIPAIPVYSGSGIKFPVTKWVAQYTIPRDKAYSYSDVLVASTDMIRCRSLSLAYDLNEKLLQRIGVKRLQVKASMTNPFMWVRDGKWEGLDPETANWPARRTASLSLQVMF